MADKMMDPVHHLISHRNDLKMFKMQVDLGTTGE